MRIISMIAAAPFRDSLLPQRIASAFADIIKDQGYHKQNHHARKHRAQHIYVTERFDFLAADVGNQGGSASGRMQRFGDLHGHNGEGHSESRCQPDLVRNKLVYRNANNCTDQMPADEVARLCQRTIDNAIDEDGRGPKRADHKKSIVKYKIPAADKAHKSYPDKGTQKSKHVLFRIDQCFLIENIPGLTVIVFDFPDHRSKYKNYFAGRWRYTVQRFIYLSELFGKASHKR